MMGLDGFRLRCGVATQRKCASPFALAIGAMEATRFLSAAAKIGRDQTTKESDRNLVASTAPVNGTTIILSAMRVNFLCPGVPQQTHVGHVIVLYLP